MMYLSVSRLIPPSTRLHNIHKILIGIFGTLMVQAADLNQFQGQKKEEEIFA